MEKLHKEPDVRRQDYNAFINELKQFHQNKGTVFRHLPRINGREIDLFTLYNQVTAMGGWQKVNDQQKWDVVVDVLKLPKACANSSLALRQLYIRYLGHYEKIHFLGEEPDHDRNHQSSESHSRKQPVSLMSQVPMHYNHSQHEVTDTSRATAGLSQDFVKKTNYDKLCMSLLSGLPNEQELALNVCTILSNEGNHMLHLEEAPKLVNLLIAQTGIWPKDDPTFEAMYLSTWKHLKGRNMRRFWRNALDLNNQQLMEILGCNVGTCEEERFLNLESDVGAHNVEGQRVLRVALILHNLSFEKNNVPVLVSNSNFLRFLLICIHSSWSNLKQVAYDTLVNLASEIKLSIEKDICSRVMFRTVMDGIQSPDRFMVIRSLDILSQLCLCEPNEDIIPSRLDVEVYQRMVSYLTVRDIMLLIFTLEALYALSDLGRYACEKIVRVHRAIGALVSLLTLDPNQYGPSAQIKMKMVETLVPAEADSSETEEQKPPITTTASSQTTSASSTTPTKAVTTVAGEQSESERFVCEWLKTTYEVVAGSTVSRNDLYADYVSHCTKSGKRGVVNANVFANCVKAAFPHCGLKKVESANGIITFHHDGLKRKKVLTTQTGPPVTQATNSTPAITTSKVAVSAGKSTPVSTPKPVQKLNHSPILKAQLSAPPRTVPTPSVVKRQLQPASCQKSVSPSPPPSPCYPSPSTTPSPNPPPPSPVNSGSSTLIKSLLATKVQQRNLQRQQVVQPNVGKVVIYTPDKVPAMNRSVLQSPPHVMRAIRPVTQTCVTPQMQQRPIQARIFTSKNRMAGATPPPRVIKQNPLIAPKLPKTNKNLLLPNSMTAAAAARLNGVQRDVQLEVCSQAEEARNLVGTPVGQETRIKRIQNHVGSEKHFIADSNDSVITSDGESVHSLKESSFSSDSEKNFVVTQLGENSSLLRPAQGDVALSSGNSVIVRSISSTGDAIFTLRDQNGSNMTFVNSGSVTCQPSIIHPIVQPKTSTPTTLLKSVLDVDLKSEDFPRKKQDMDKIKRAPLLNGLLDKGKNFPPKDLITGTVIQNGSKPNNSTPEALVEESRIIAANVQTAVAPTVISTAFQANGDSLMQICGGQTTLSGTIEVQPDQKGVVRLHIESPENSNQGSDLSSISDIARTLECASKAISRTNAECNSQQVPFTDCTTATVTVITTNTPTLARTGQQIIVVTPALNQPQLHIQSPNIKFRILHSVSKVEDSVDLIGFPRVSLNQFSQMRQADTTPSTSNTNKRPSNEPPTTPTIQEAKKPRLDTKTPLLEATLRLPTTVPCSVSMSGGDSKPFHDSHQILLPKSIQMEHVSQAPKLSTAKAVAVPVQNVEFPSEREMKTFSGLSSASEPTSVSTSTHVPTKTVLSSKLEYLCEWKDCGKRFPTPGAVFVHASRIHAPLSNDDMICLWEGCDTMKRRRFSLLTHLQDWHCNERALHLQAVRRKQLTQQGKTTIAPPQPPPPHPGYAPDAALLAIRRHALQYITPKELSEEKESALTKSIRLTSALILRNLVTHSPLARSYLRRYEPELAYLAMSPVESSRTIAQCLSELSRPHE